MPKTTTMARFTCATWRPIGVNTGGRLTPNLGLILHHQVGNGSLFGWFGNPAAKVSAHFWVSKNGIIEQYVDTDVVAWHATSLNSRYVGVETEGCPGGRDEPMTAAMVTALARLYAEGNRRHGWANALIASNGARGFGFHRMNQATACPCQVRLNMRGEILNRAFGPGGGGGVPPNPPPPSGIPVLHVDGIWIGHNDRHPDVRVWQSKMAQRGWTISADGQFGPQSDRVCRQFQAEKKLGTDGKVGPVTWRATWTAPT